MQPLRLRGRAPLPRRTRSRVASGDAHASATVSRSSSRNRASPWRSKISATDMPVVATTMSSVSTKARSRICAHRCPTVVFPAPMSPTSTRCLPRHVSGGTDVRGVVARELFDGVAAELARRLAREHERDHRLGHHTRSRDRGHVGALLERDRLFLGLGVDGAQHRPVERGQAASSRRAPRAEPPVVMPPSVPPARVPPARTPRRRRPRGSRRATRCRAARRPRSRHRSPRPSSPGCS